MNIQIKIDELNFCSSDARLEAFRRAKEIREFSGMQNGNSSCGQERFLWKTKTKTGYEVEEVVFDTKKGTISYSYHHH